MRVCQILNLAGKPRQNLLLLALSLEVERAGKLRVSVVHRKQNLAVMHSDRARCALNGGYSMACSIKRCLLRKARNNSTTRTPSENRTTLPPLETISSSFILRPSIAEICRKLSSSRVKLLPRVLLERLNGRGYFVSGRRSLNVGHSPCQRTFHGSSRRLSVWPLRRREQIFRSARVDRRVRLRLAGVW